MSAASDGSSASRSSGQAGEADSLDLDGHQTTQGGERPQAVGLVGRVAEAQRAAADSIPTRYSTMASAGLSVKDLRRPTLDRLAIKDSRGLTLIEGYPPHPRADESKGLVSDSLMSDAYRATFDREKAEWESQSGGRQAGIAGQTAASTPRGQAGTPPEPSTAAQHRDKTAAPTERTETESNSMRAEKGNAAKRHAIPPLEDRFNVIRIGLVEKQYHFRDQAGKVAFTDKFMSISTGSESPAAIQAMVDRAAERGWKTVRLNGSSEFVRQGWIAATAQGLRVVGHAATIGDREAAAKELARLQVRQDGPVKQRPGEAVARVQLDHVEQVRGNARAAQLDGHRQLAAAIEKALADGKVSPELRGQVRAMMRAEGAKRIARGERFKAPVYDGKAPRTRPKTVQAGPPRHGERERSR